MINITILTLVTGSILGLLIHRYSKKWEIEELDDFLKNKNNTENIYVKTDDKNIINKLKNKYNSKKLNIKKEPGRQLVIINDKIWMKEETTKPVSIRNPVKKEYYIERYFN